MYSGANEFSERQLTSRRLRSGGRRRYDSACVVALSVRIPPVNPASFGRLRLVCHTQGTPTTPATYLARRGEGNGGNLHAIGAEFDLSAVVRGSVSLQLAVNAKDSFMDSQFGIIVQVSPGTTFSNAGSVDLAVNYATTNGEQLVSMGDLDGWALITGADAGNLITGGYNVSNILPGTPSPLVHTGELGVGLNLAAPAPVVEVFGGGEYTHTIYISPRTIVDSAKPVVDAVRTQTHNNQWTPRAPPNRAGGGYGMPRF